VAPYARRLVGVDLSDGMLAQAREKRVYDELVKAELTDYLSSAREAFDLIVSADALVYFGDLEAVLSAAAGALGPNGFFIFTLEHAVTARSDVDYRLEWHGRYSHTSAYVERLIARAGLQAAITQAELRTESGAPVAGLVVRATKQAHPTIASMSRTW
jgi:predicted TPR repeat methyltransferase